MSVGRCAQWIHAHNRQVQTTGRGVRIVNCYLPIKSPWLNPIEPKWAHGKRRVVEPTRLLPAAELRARVCAAFDCPGGGLAGPARSTRCSSRYSRRGCLILH